MKKITFIFVFFILVVSQAVMAETRPGVSIHIGEQYYHLGGGAAIPPPGAGFRSFSIKAKLKMGYSYSCGKFDYHNNLEDMINQINSRVQELPDQLAAAGTAYAVSLPGYLAMKYNPTLANILKQTIDSSAELFNMSYKSCEQVEAEMQKDKTANPYDGFIQASVLNKWSIGAKKTGGNKPVMSDLDSDIKKNPGGSVPWYDGKNVGTSDTRPIETNKDFVVAGYNLMIGRVNELSSLKKPPSHMRSEPVALTWATPALAGEWVQRVVGEIKITLDKPDEKKEAIPGDGLRPEVETMTLNIRDALQKAYKERNFEDISKFTSVNFSAYLVDTLHQLQYGQAMLMMDKLASEMAVNEVQEQVFLIIQMMDMAIKSPDMATSTAGPTAIKYVRDVTYASFETMLAQIHSDIDLKNKTVNTTTIAILNLAERARLNAARAVPDKRSEFSILGGGVKKLPVITPPPP